MSANPDPKREKEIFESALELASPAERAAYIKGACGDNPILRQRIEALLAAHEGQSKFLQDNSAAADAVSTLVVEVKLTEVPGSVIGRYKLLEQIGEGGFGSVWAAEQREPVKRRVALKIIKLGMDTKQVVARFEAERQALALMDHPNIAKVLDAGTTDNGRPFFVMELVKGIPVTKYCDQEQLSTQDRLDLFIKVCQAIQHAHQKGIIHRDIKPSNILVTLHDGVPVPKVIDFGIAKATQQELTELTIYTQHQQFIGTPAYMSPEQAEMSGLDIDTRSDIYSLGVLLYELLTGSTPFNTKELMQSGIDEMRRIIREQEPVRPSTKLSQTLAVAPVHSAKHASRRASHSAIESDLDWIVMKCLEKDRARRYETANGLAADLMRHLSNEPVVARPPSAAYKFQKAWRRNKLVYSAGLAVAAALLIGITISARQTIRATRAEKDQSKQREIAIQALDGEKLQHAQAEEQRQRAENNERDTRQRAYGSDINLAQQSLDAGKLGLALELLNQPELKNERGWEWRYLWLQSRSEALATFYRATRAVIQLEASPDGHWLVVFESSGILRLWDLATRKPVAELVGSGASRPVFSPCRNLLAYAGRLTSGSNEFGVRIWDPATRQHLAEFPAGWCRGFAFSADEKTLVTCDDRRRWDPETGRGSISSCAVSRWQFPEGRKLSTYTCDRPPFYDQSGVPFAISSDANFAAIGGYSGEVVMVNLDTGTELWRSKGTDGRGYSLAFSPDGMTLAIGTGTQAGYILLLDTETGRERQRLIGHRSAVASLIYSADGNRLFSASHDQKIGLWDIHNPSHIPAPRLLRGHRIEVWSLALLSDGRTLASSSKDGEVLLWDSASGQRNPFVTSDEIPADSIWCLSGEGEATMGVNLATRELLEWRGAGHALQRIPLLLEAGARRARWSQDGRFLAVGSTNGSVQIWDASERRLSGQFAVGTNSVELLQFDRESQRLAVVTGSTFEIWTLAPFRKTFSTEIPAGYRINDYSGYVFFAPELAPNLDLVLMRESRSDGRSVSLWSPAIGHIVKLPEDSEASPEMDNGIAGVAFSPDGALVALCCFNGETRVHDTRTGSRRASLRGFFNDASAVCFSPDGRRLAIGSGGEGNIKIYHTATWRELLTLSSGAQWNANIRFSRTGDVLRMRIAELVDQKLVEKLQFCRVPSWDEIAAAEAKEKTEIKKP